MFFNEKKIVNFSDIPIDEKNLTETVNENNRNIKKIEIKSLAN